MIQLRPYQSRDVAAIRGHFGAGRRSVLYVLPTGGGKTYTFSYITQGAAAKRNPVGILVHRKELLAQASASLAALGVEHGIIAPVEKIREIIHIHQTKFGRSFVNDGALVQVASVQTLARPNRLSRYAHLFRLLIVDEAHHSTAGQWSKIIEAATNARVLGVTATPIRTDGQGLGRHAGGIFDSLVLGPTMGELIRDGHLVPPLVFAPPNNLDMKGVRRSGGDHDKKQTEARVLGSSIVGDSVAHYRRLLNGAPAIAFCVSVRAAEQTAMEFRAAGIRAVSVSGNTPDIERFQSIEGLSNGRVQVLTSCDIISEGTDIPVVAGAILLRPTDSEGLFLQQVGRALRPAPGKDRAIILDHVGNCITHGLPEEDRFWTLDGIEKNKRGGFLERGPPIRQCPACFVAHVPGPYCPYCGHEYTAAERSIEVVDGELEELNETQKQSEARARRRRIGQAQTLDEFLELAREFKYSKGWAYKMVAVREEQKNKGAAA